MILSKLALIIFYIFIFLLAVILLILIMPFSYFVFLNIYNTDVNGIVTIKWLRSFIGIKINLDEKCFQFIFLDKLFPKISFEDTKNFDKPTKDKEKRKRKLHIKDIDFHASYNIFLESISRIFKNIKPDYLKIKGIYGFDDPSINGLTYGIISILKGFKSFKLNVFPVFAEEIIDIEIESYGKIRLMSLIIIFISTIIKKPIRKLFFNKKDKTIIKSKLN